MRAVVLGYREFGCLGLAALKRHGFDVVAVLTHRDDPHEAAWWPSLAQAAQSAGVQVFYPESMKDPAVVDLIGRLAPDFLFSFYFRDMIPAPILALARHGALNLHGSLLPKLRGRAPINWAILNGEKETGVSLHDMVAKPDAGDLVDQERVAIDPCDTAYTLTKKLVPAAQRLLDRTLPRLAAGTATRVPLDLTQGSYFGRRSAEDGRIDWSLPAVRIYDLVRAVTHPYPGAFTTLDGRKLSVWWAQPTHHVPAAAAGTITHLDRDGALVAAGGDSLRLVTVQFAGEPETPAAALAAWGIAPGHRCHGDCT